MRTTSISFSYRRKFNLGNYEAVEIEATQWAQVDEDEDPDGCMALLAEQCKNHVRANIPPGYASRSQVTGQSKHTVGGLEVDGTY